MEEENLNDRHGNDDLLLPQLHTDTTRTVCARAAPYKMHTASALYVCAAPHKKAKQVGTGDKTGKQAGWLVGGF